MVAIDHRQQGDGAAVDDDFALGRRAVGELDGLQGEVDLAALVDDAAIGGRHGMILGLARVLAERNRPIEAGRWVGDLPAHVAHGC